MTVSTSVGPVSGIDYGKLITGLIGIEQKPIDDITKRLDTISKQNTSLLGLSTLLTGLKIAGASFTSAGVFRAATATAINPSVLSAKASLGAPTGSYGFNVQRLAAASQQVTQGFASSTTALGLSGSIKLQLGGGKVDDVASLTSLNGGTGVARGSIRVTDRSGASALIDLSHAVDIRDVADAISGATSVNLSAKLDGDKLVITDNTAGAGTLSITNVGSTTTATDLGLNVASVSGVLTGASVTGLKAGTTLDSLNDGAGVRTVGILTDFTITGAAGTSSISLNGTKTIGDVISKINSTLTTTNGASGITAVLSSDGHGITLTDSGGGPITVAAQNGSLAATDLGIEGTGTATLAGRRIGSALQGPLLSSLNGGLQKQAGEVTPIPGTLTINGETVDLSSATTLADAVKLLNTNGQGVTASINNAGTGIDLASNSASFTVADGTGNLASFLHIAGTSTSTGIGSKVSSGDLRLRYLSNNTRLSTLNGGVGVRAGSIRITANKNASDPDSTEAVTLDFSSSTFTTVGQVIDRLNTSGLGVTARVNDTGDGILLTQTQGNKPLKIEEVGGGSTAKDLGILGTASNNKLDGSFQETIDIVSTDKLTDIAKKLNDANAGVSVSIINDGSGASPFRLSLSSRNTGFAGRLIFDGSAAGLNTTTLVQGQDAAVIFGSNANGSGGLASTGSSNIITGLVPGLTLTLNSVGNTTVTVNRDDSKIKDSIQAFVDSYNKVIDNIAEVTKFDPSDPTKKGELFGDATVRQVQDGLNAFVSRSYSGVGKFKTLAAVGISIGQDGKLSFDDDKLATLLSSNPDDVRSFFTTSIKAVTGGPRVISASTLLDSLGGTTFPGGHINITDGNGVGHDIDLSTGVTTVGDVLSRINAGTAGTVTAAINNNGDGIALTQVGGAGNASVAEVNGGLTAAALNIKGTFSGGLFNGAFLPTLPVSAVKGLGANLSDILDRFTDSHTGLIFKGTDSLTTLTTQLKSRQTDLSALLENKKNRLIRQFAMLEVTISQLQSQGTALSSYQTAAAKSS